MDLTNTLADLKTQLAQVDDAIKAFERLALSRRGVVAAAAPKAASKPAQRAPAGRKPRKRRKPLSAEVRQKMSEAQRNRRAAQRAQEESQA